MSAAASWNVNLLILDLKETDTPRASEGQVKNTLILQKHMQVIQAERALC